MTEEKRRHPRTVVDFPVALRAAGQTVDARMADVSEGGAGIEFSFSAATPVQFDIGSRVELAPAAGDRRTGRIVRQYTNGIGVKFE